MQQLACMQWHVAPDVDFCHGQWQSSNKLLSSYVCIWFARCMRHSCTYVTRLLSVRRLLVMGSSRMQHTVPAAFGLGVGPPGPGVPCGPDHAAMLCVQPLPSAAAFERAL